MEEFNNLEGATPPLLTAAAISPDAQAKASDSFDFLASMGELPEVRIPIGQVQYFSVLSSTWESIPVTVQLVARKGCDQMLLDFILRLAEVGVVNRVFWCRDKTTQPIVLCPIFVVQLVLRI